jgi:hypothetical protein
MWNFVADIKGLREEYTCRVILFENGAEENIYTEQGWNNMLENAA